MNLTPEQKLTKIADLCHQVIGSAGTRMFNFADSILDIIEPARSQPTEHRVVEMFAGYFGTDTLPPTNWHWVCSCGVRKDNIAEQVKALNTWRDHVAEES